MRNRDLDVVDRELTKLSSPVVDRGRSSVECLEKLQRYSSTWLWTRLSELMSLRSGAGSSWCSLTDGPTSVKGQWTRSKRAQLYDVIGEFSGCPSRSPNHLFDQALRTWSWSTRMRLLYGVPLLFLRYFGRVIAGLNSSQLQRRKWRRSELKRSNEREHRGRHYILFRWRSTRSRDWKVFDRFCNSVTNGHG